jgi:hypothetical protein
MFHRLHCRITQLLFYCNGGKKHAANKEMDDPGPYSGPVSSTFRFPNFETILVFAWVK